MFFVIIFLILFIVLSVASLFTDYNSYKYYSNEELCSILEKKIKEKNDKEAQRLYEEICIRDFLAEKDMLDIQRTMKDL